MTQWNIPVLVLGFSFSVWQRDKYAFDFKWLTWYFPSCVFLLLFFLYIIICASRVYFKNLLFSHCLKTSYNFFLVMTEADFLPRKYLLLQLGQRTCLSSVSLTGSIVYEEIFLRPSLFQNKQHWGSAYPKTIVHSEEEIHRLPSFTSLIVLDFPLMP